MAKRRRQAVVAGERIEDLTIHHYERAWELIQGKAPISQVLRLVKLTNSQLQYLWRSGLPGRKGRYPAQPSFELRLAEQQAALQSAGVEGAALVSVKGVQVLGQTLRNGEVANEIAEMILTYQRDALRAAIEVEMAKPQAERRPMSALLAENSIGEQGQALLRTLRGWADIRVPTMAYGKMFGIDLTKLVTSGQLPTGVIDTEAREKLPASLTMREEMGGAAGTGAINAEIAKQFDGWTEEELERYLAGMGEPAQKS